MGLQALTPPHPPKRGSFREAAGNHPVPCAITKLPTLGTGDICWQGSLEAPEFNGATVLLLLQQPSFF